MEKCGQVILCDQKRLSKMAPPPNCSDGNAFDRKLEIAVIFSSVETTIAALDRAGALLRGLEGRISLVEVQIVPYPLPLESPPVALDFAKQRLRAIANGSTFVTLICVYLCRFRFAMLASVLIPGSIVVIGCRKSWWSTWEKKLARDLKCAGYETVLLEMG